MVGQVVAVAGIVTSLRHGFTKSRRPFVSAVLEDLVGSVEVSCWAELYQQTEKLWVEGNLLLVQGRVRARQEGVQLVCQQVHQYRPEAGVEEGLAPSPAEPLPGGKRMLISIAQTESEQEDLARLYRLLDIMRHYPGQDEVELAIATSEGLVKLELPNVATDYCPELHRELAEIVGEEGLTVEGRP